MAEPSSHFSFWFNPLVLVQLSALSGESCYAIVSPHSADSAQWLQMYTVCPTTALLSTAVLFTGGAECAVS